MAENSPPEFMLDGDDQESDEFYQEEMRDLRFEKLSQRVTILSILMPCLIAVALYFGYRDLTRRVHQETESGNTEVQQLARQMEALSKQFNEKLITFSTTLSAQDKDFDNTVTDRLGSINKSIEVLNQNQENLDAALEQTGKNLEALSAYQADIKENAADIARISADLAPIKKDLRTLGDVSRDVQAVSSEIENLKSRIAAELAAMSGTIDKFARDNESFKESVNRQLSDKIDKTALAVELLMFKKNQNLHSQEIAELNRKLDAIRGQIEGSRSAPQSNRRPLESRAQQVPSIQSPPVGNTGSAGRTPPSNSGDIDVQEQDLPKE